MDQLVAETIARATREEAQRQARQDLDRLRNQAVEAGRERSRTTFKISIIDEESGSISYNPAGRLLRDWYLHVYLNTLRSDLGQPYEVIDCAEADETRALLQQLRLHSPAVQATLAVRTAQVSAMADAAAAARAITERLHRSGAVLAIRHVPDDRFDGDQLRIHVMRHWYEHCYDDVVDEALQVRHPLSPDTQTQDHHVAVVLASREVRQLIGPDGVPLATIRAVTRESAPSQKPAHVAALPRAVSTRLEQRVSQAWTGMDETDRARWLKTAGAFGSSTASNWSGLDTSEQFTLIEHYLQQLRQELNRSDLRAQAGVTALEAARRMFNHPLASASSLEGTKLEPGRNSDWLLSPSDARTQERNSQRSAARQA